MYIKIFIMSHCPHPQPSIHIFEDYQPYDHNTAAVAMLEMVVPRFGYSTNLTTLIVGSKQEVVDYGRGVTTGPLVIAFIFLVWILLSMYLKCRATQRTRWLSGTRVNPLPEVKRNSQPRQRPWQMPVGMLQTT